MRGVEAYFVGHSQPGKVELPTDRLFKSRTVRWLLTNVKRICKKAGVPEICTHALRGTHSTLATEHGVTGQVVAAALGHESVSTTYGNYTDPSAIANARSRRVAQAMGLLIPPFQN